MANWEDMYPCKTPLDNKIKLLLVMRGYPRGKICFRGEENNRELRYAYWKYIDSKDIEYVETFTGCKLNTFSTEDSDCGDLTSYIIKENTNVNRPRHSSN